MIQRSDNAGVIAPPPLMALAVVAFGLLLDWLVPAYVLTVLLPHSARMVIGLLLIAGSGALAVPAILAFRAAGTSVEPWKASQALVTAGIFRWVRNPMYVGLILLLVGLAVLLASDWMLVLTVVFVFALHYGVVKREERYLESKFGNAYRRYRDAVPRYGWPG